MVGEEFEGLAELVRFFGWRRASEIMGTCLLLALWEGPRAMDNADEAPSASTKARLRADGRRFRRYLEARGKAYLLGEPGQEIERFAEMASRRVV